MNLSVKSPKIELLLRPHQLLNLNNSGEHMAIECTKGTLWVTSAGDNRDHMLQAGRRFVPKTNGTVLIEAIDDACVDIEEN